MKKKLDVLENSAGLKPDNTRVEEKANLFEDLFIGEDDIFDIDDLKDEDKKHILDLINKTDFSQEGNIYFKKDNDEEMKPAIIKDETKNDLKIEDLLLPKPEIFQKKIKEKIFLHKKHKKSFKNKKRMNINDRLKFVNKS